MPLNNKTKLLKRSVWAIDETLSGTPSLSQSEPLTYGNKGVVNSPNISRTGPSWSDAISCHTQNTLFFFWHYLFAHSSMISSIPVLNKLFELFQPVHWVFRIYRMHFSKYVRLSNVCLKTGLDDVLVLWEMLWASSLPLLPNFLWSRLVVLVKVIYLGQVEQLNH